MSMCSIWEGVVGGMVCKSLNFQTLKYYHVFKSKNPVQMFRKTKHLFFSDRQKKQKKEPLDKIPRLKKSKKTMIIFFVQKYSLLFFHNFLQTFIVYLYKKLYRKLSSHKIEKIIFVSNFFIRENERTDIFPSNCFFRFQLLLYLLTLQH